MRISKFSRWYAGLWVFFLIFLVNSEARSTSPDFVQVVIIYLAITVPIWAGLEWFARRDEDDRPQR
jgi:hypothetical protein